MSYESRFYVIKKFDKDDKETENLLQMYIRDKLGIDRIYKETGIDERY